MAKEAKNNKENSSFMIKVATFIVDRRNLFFLMFGIALIFSVVSMNWVKVENALSAYLPNTTETSKGLDRMEEQFITYGTAKVMVSNIPYEEADRIYQEMDALDSIIMLDFDNSSEHYNNFSALYDITFGYEETDERALEALNEVKEMLADYDIYVSKQFLHKDDHVLIIDDFLAKGSALSALINLIEHAGAKTVGAGIVIEKAFQEGGKIIRDMGVRVESLARIQEMTEDGGIVFCN